MSEETNHLSQDERLEADEAFKVIDQFIDGHLPRREIPLGLSLLLVYVSDNGVSTCVIQSLRDEGERPMNDWQASSICYGLDHILTNIEGGISTIQGIGEALQRQVVAQERAGTSQAGSRDIAPGVREHVRKTT